MKKIIISYNSLVLTCILVVLCTFTCSEHQNKNTVLESYIQQMKFEKQKTEALYIDEMNAYIKKVAPTSALSAISLYEGCLKYEINPVFALAQGEIESHFGTKGRACRTNSLWNVGAYDDGKDRHKYKNINESIIPYLRLLKHSYMIDKSELDLMDNFVNKHGKRYASDEAYEKRLKAKYLNILTTTKLDSLQKELNYYNQII